MTRRPTLAAVALLAALGAGCAAPSQEPRMDPAAQLAARTTSAQAVARYEQMQLQIRQQLDAALGPHPWKVTGKGDQAGCGGGFTHTGGIVVYLDPWGFDGSLPDTDWPRARQIITTVTAQYGFTQPTLQIDQPGHHETTALDPTLGAQYNFATQIDTSIQVTTGCHRP